MSHHSDEPLPDPSILRKLMDTGGFRGAIGAHPEGKLNAVDEGSIQFAVGVTGGKVVLDFGTPVKWLGMNAQQAADLAQLLFAKAREAGRKNGECIHMTIG